MLEPGLVEIVRHPSLEAAAAFVAEEVADWIEGCAAGLPAALALPGEALPESFARTLADRDLRWAEVVLTCTDDDNSHRENPLSGSEALRNALAGTPAAARVLALDHPSVALRARSFDLVVLRMDEEGRVAGLRPGDVFDSPGLPPVIAVPSTRAADRLTLSMSALVSAKRILLLVDGREERRTLGAALGASAALPLGILMRHACCPVTVHWNGA